MPITARASMPLYTHRPLTGVRVAACVGSEPFGTPTDKLTGI